MALTLLLDLDDTLLGNKMDTFIQPYMAMLSARLAACVDPVLAARQLLIATRMMFVNNQPDKTLEQVFDANFFPPLGVSRVQVQPIIDSFYAEDFPTLQDVTTTFPQARALVEEAARRGYRMGVATSPLFPMTAIQQRLAWAGFANGDHPFELVSSYDSFHFTKPNPAYFAEFLGRMGWPEGPVVMIGNDLSDDISGARCFGLPVYWINHGQMLPAGLDRIPGNGPIPHGRLEDFLEWLDCTPPDKLMPSFDHPDGMLAILRSTPAVMSGLVQNTPAEFLHQRPEPGQWAPGEVFCHMRDVDAEVNLPRFNLVLQQANPFIAGRSTDEWADSRHYIEQDGLRALADFTRHRMELLKILDALSPADWDLPIRHAIFGPTHLRELVRIISEHDRLHIHQVYAAIQAANPA